MASLPLFDRRDGPALCSVSELTGQIKDVLETDFADVALIGEVSNLARPRSGHVYLSLKDDSARVFGDLAVYAPRGEYQITIRRVEPEGIGALELAFRQRFEKLKAEGLFDPDRKRPLPRFPRTIVVVSSPTGAAVRDFLQVTGRRWSATTILIAPARVQGIGAAEEVAAAIALANRVEGADLIVVARGGGSLEDLWTFNEEVVARAIANSTIPVVSAIGHEVDVTLADHASDFRALTPSEAGERVVPDAREARQALEHFRNRLARDARDRLADARQGVDDLAEALDRGLRRQVDDRRNRLGRIAGKLEALSPLGVLARGYALAFRQGETTPLTDPARVKAGDAVRIRLAGGTIDATVDQINTQ
jgi:exodeoxyribonuclease VII large subunit